MCRVEYSNSCAWWVTVSKLLLDFEYHRYYCPLVLYISVVFACDTDTGTIQKVAYGKSRIEHHKFLVQGSNLINSKVVMNISYPQLPKMLKCQNIIRANYASTPISHKLVFTLRLSC